MRQYARLTALIGVICLLPILGNAESPSSPIVHEIESEFQSAKTEIRVLLPKSYCREKRYRVLYVLPVEAGTGTRWGDPLAELTKLDLASEFDVICVSPTFSELPWYANHPTNPQLQQERYLLETVIPFIDKHYSTEAKGVGRYLVGFSKSGWGAFSLILRHPDLFHKASAWDAPLMMSEPGKYGSGPIFGTAQNFKRYQVTRLLEEKAAAFANETRLISLGYDNFREHHLQLHELMQKANLKHIHRDGPQRKHHWESGWLEEAVGLLFETSVGTER